VTDMPEGTPARVAPTALRWNATSNTVARLIQAGLSLIAVPLILRFIGTQQYGLVGFAIALDAFQYFDFGLTGAVYRQVARNSATGRSGESAEILRAAGVPYLLIGVVLSGALALAAPWLSGSWFHSKADSGGDITLAIEFLALSFGIKWPFSLYSGALRGLQKHVLVNVLNIAGALARTVIGVAVVAFVSHTASALFLSQALVFGVQLFVVIRLAHRHVGRARRPYRSRRDILRGMWRFAIALNVISMGIALLTQLPGLMVGRVLGLHSLGVYAIAYTVAAVVLYLPNAVTDAAFPRLSGEFARADIDAVRTTYLRSTRITIAASAGIAFAILFFAQPLLLLWTHSRPISAAASRVAGLLALGNLGLAIWDMPYTLLLAKGRTRLLITTVLLSLPALAAGLAVGLSNEGLDWAGWVWLVLNGAVCGVVVVSAHRMIPVKAAWKYMLEDVAPFSLLAAVIFGGERWLLGPGLGPVGVFWLGLGLLVYTCGCVAILPRTDREWLSARASRARRLVRGRRHRPEASPP
jgi:O-antigen/teichoic acid export membrane protein